MDFQPGEEYSCRFVMQPKGERAVEVIAFFNSDCFCVRATHAGDDIIISDQVAKASSVAFDLLFGVPNERR